MSSGGRNGDGNGAGEGGVDCRVKKNSSTEPNELLDLGGRVALVFFFLHIFLLARP